MPIHNECIADSCTAQASTKDCVKQIMENTCMQCKIMHTHRSAFELREL